MLALRILAFPAGAVLVILTFVSAIRTFVVPRGTRDVLSRGVFLTLRRVFELVTHFTSTYTATDRIFVLYAPFGLLLLPIVWLALVLIGYMLMFWALDTQPWVNAFTLSGSSLLTLGFAPVESFAQKLLTFSEAAIGLILVALLIAYLPTIYGAFARREAAVTMLEVRAGSPPAAVEMLLRFQRLNRLDKLSDVWQQWEAWFVDVEESHTSLAALSFFRSPQPDRSWVTAAGTVLDAAALLDAAVDMPADAQANLTIRAGYLCLRRIAAYFRIPFDATPAPSDPISITREEFDEALDRLAAGGVPLKPDRAEAWRAFSGWRVNYDTVLLIMATITLAPEAPWTADRGPIRRVEPHV